MSDAWFDDPEGPDVDGPGPLEQLQVIRTLLERDYLSRMDWKTALRDLAIMVHRGLKAHGAMVALWQEGPRAGWTAVTHTGQELEASDLSSAGSRAALERGRESRAPWIATVDPQLEVDSASIRDLQASSMLVVPLFFWNMEEERPERRWNAVDPGAWRGGTGSRGKFF